MTINATFNSYEEMLDFAKKFAGTSSGTRTAGGLDLESAKEFARKFVPSLDHPEQREVRQKQLNSLLKKHGARSVKELFQKRPEEVAVFYEELHELAEAPVEPAEPAAEAEPAIPAPEDEQPAKEAPAPSGDKPAAPAASTDAGQEDTPSPSEVKVLAAEYARAEDHPEQKEARRAQLRSLLDSFGAKSVTKLLEAKPEAAADFYQKLKALKEGPDA